ncbi:hypothetical protein N0V90_001845 [Kalmusia sp. IMI 367209]|nr:hypothetical protein N0V90_001845 [Kalmusia sp. IMI 367209]
MMLNKPDKPERHDNGEDKYEYDSNLFPALDFQDMTNMTMQTDDSFDDIQWPSDIFTNSFNHYQDTPSQDNFDGQYTTCDGESSVGDRIKRENDDDDYSPGNGAGDFGYDEHTYSDHTGKKRKINKNGQMRKVREPRGSLRRWDEADVQKALCGIIWACGENGIPIPFEQAAQWVDSSCTASALQQAALKIHQKLNASGGQYPRMKMAWPKKHGRPGITTKTISRDNSKVPRRKPTKWAGTQTNLVTLRRDGGFVFEEHGLQCKGPQDEDVLPGHDRLTNVEVQHMQQPQQYANLAISSSTRSATPAHSRPQPMLHNDADAVAQSTQGIGSESIDIKQEASKTTPVYLTPSRVESPLVCPPPPHRPHSGRLNHFGRSSSSYPSSPTPVRYFQHPDSSGLDPSSFIQHGPTHSSGQGSSGSILTGRSNSTQQGTGSNLEQSPRGRLNHIQQARRNLAHYSQGSQQQQGSPSHNDRGFFQEMRNDSNDQFSNTIMPRSSTYTANPNHLLALSSSSGDSLYGRAQAADMNLAPPGLGSSNNLQSPFMYRNASANLGFAYPANNGTTSLNGASEGVDMTQHSSFPFDYFVGDVMGDSGYATAVNDGTQSTNSSEGSGAIQDNDGFARTLRNEYDTNQATNSLNLLSMSLYPPKSSQEASSLPKFVLGMDTLEDPFYKG